VGILTRVIDAHWSASLAGFINEVKINYDKCSSNKADVNTKPRHGYFDRQLLRAYELSQEIGQIVTNKSTGVTK